VTHWNYIENEGEHLNKRLLTVTEAAAFLAVKPRTIYAWVAERRIPYRKVGRLLRFDQTELRAWSEAQAKVGEVDERLRVVNW
jgi:excisionase family DNA binding protein